MVSHSDEMHALEEHFVLDKCRARVTSSLNERDKLIGSSFYSETSA